MKTYTISEVANLFGVNKKLVRLWISNKLLPTKKLLGFLPYTLVKEEELQKFSASMNQAMRVQGNRAERRKLWKQNKRASWRTYKKEGL